MAAARLACLALAAAVASATPSLAADSRFDLPEGPGRALVYGQCQTCHDLQSVKDSAGIRKGAWDAVLDNMANFGLRLTDDQRERILGYLGTYLGPNPPEAPAGTATAGGSADGARLFADICASCHEENGAGKEDKFPPLAGNEDLFLSADFPALVVLNGLRGKITVNGATYDRVMPAFAMLSDAEIAAVVAYVRSNFGNAALRPAGMGDPDTATVTDLRGRSLTAADVYDLRQSLESK